MAARLSARAARVGMRSWRGLHVGQIQCYREKERHAVWRWGKKKGLRRARRRLEAALIQEAL